MQTFIATPSWREMAVQELSLNNQWIQFYYVVAPAAQVLWFQRQAMTDLMDSPLLAPLADLLTPDKVETLQEMARVFYANRSDISIARFFFSWSFSMIDCPTDQLSTHAWGRGHPLVGKNQRICGWVKWPNIWSRMLFTGQGFEGQGPSFAQRNKKTVKVKYKDSRLGFLGFLTNNVKCNIVNVVTSCPRTTDFLSDLQNVSHSGLLWHFAGFSSSISSSSSSPHSTHQHPPTPCCLSITSPTGGLWRFWWH